MSRLRGFGQITRVRWLRYTARYQGPDACFYDSPVVFPGKIYAKGWLVGEKRLIDSGEWTPPTTRPVEYGKYGVFVDPTNIIGGT